MTIDPTIAGAKPQKRKIPLRTLLVLLLLSICAVAYLLTQRTAPERYVPATGRMGLPDSLRRSTGRASAAEDSTTSPIAGASRQLSSPALEQRKAARRILQRTGYANVLADVIRRDGGAALLSLMRMNAQVSYSLSHRPVVLYFPIVAPPDSMERAGRVFSFHYSSSHFAVTLHEDWSMPEDPWR